MSASPFKSEVTLHHMLAVLVIGMALAASWDSKLLGLWRPSMRQGALEVPPVGAGKVCDATGAFVESRNYRRIVVLDGLDIVLSLVPPDRVVTIDDWSSTHTHQAWRVSGLPIVSGTAGAEEILSHSPDLVVSGSFGNPETREKIEALRSVGISVFDLSYVIGHEDLFKNILALSTVLDVPERGQKLKDQLERRIEIMRMPLLGEGAAMRAAMVCSQGDTLSLFGGDDVFDSVLVDAGLRNAVAEQGVRLMPAGTLEKLIKIDPQVLVIRPRNKPGLLDFPGLEELPQGGTRGIVAEIPEPYLGVAVPTDYVDSAEALQDQIHNRPAPLKQ